MHLSDNHIQIILNNQIRVLIELSFVNLSTKHDQTAKF